MKKLLLLTALGVAGLAATAADNFVVYDSNGLNPDLQTFDWWNGSFTFDAEAPDGTTPVFKFTTGPQSTTDASMGLFTDANPNTGILANSTLTFDWYAVGTGNYTIRLTGPTESNYEFSVTADNAGSWQTTSLSIPEKFPTTSEEWDANKNLGKGYVFSVIVSQGADNAAIYFKNITYSDVNNDWIEPEIEIVAPSMVPSPTTNPADVASLFSSAYNPAIGFSIGVWGQATNAEIMEIDNQKVYWLRNYNYLGWEFTNDETLDVSDYDYIHVEYWTAEGEGFSFTPISQGNEYLYNATEVLQNEWNVYDVELSYFSDQGVNLSELFQFKFAGGNGTEEGFLANVYFWKEGEEAEPLNVPENLYLLGDTYAWNQEYVSSWTPAEALAFTATDEEGIFTIEAVQFNNETSYFTFTNILDEDWDVINDGTHRYCPVTMLAAASIASENPFGLGQITDGPDSWTITPGVYDITVDFNNQTFTMAVSDVEAVEPPTVVVPEALYLIGNFPTNPEAGSWDISNTLAFTEGEEGVFTLLEAELSDAGGGLAYFGLLNIKATSWDDIALENRYGPEAAVEASLTAPNAFEYSTNSWSIEPGIYDFTVDFNTLEMTITESESDAVKALNAANAEENVYYNLQGVRVANPQHGIFILNGKKVVIR